MEGYLTISRKFFRHWLWDERREYSRAEAWLDLLSMAAYQEHTRIVGNIPVRMDRGEVLASERFLESRWGWGRKKVRLFLNVLQQEKMIVVITHREGNHITILRYEDYNGTGTANSPAEEPRRNHQGTKENKGKPVNNTTTACVPESLAAIPEFGEEWGHYLAHRKHIKKPATAHAQDLILRKLALRPKESVEALQIAQTRTWTGFEWDWIDNHKAGGRNGSKTNRGSNAPSRASGTANDGVVYTLPQHTRAGLPLGNGLASADNWDDPPGT